MHPKRFGLRICTWGKVRGIVVGGSGRWWVVELVDGGGGGGGLGLDFLFGCEHPLF